MSSFDDRTFPDDYFNDLIAYANAHPKRAIKIDLFSDAYKPIAPNFKIVESLVNLPSNVSIKQYAYVEKYPEDNFWVSIRLNLVIGFL